MKKTCVIIFMIASSLWADQSSDEQLLVHLKNIRTELTSIINENQSNRSVELLELPQGEMERHNFFSKLRSDFFNKADVLQEFVTNKIAYPVFSVVCDNISLSFAQMQNKMETRPLVESSFQVLDPVKISAQVKQIEHDLYELFIPLFEKLYQEHCLAAKSNILGLEMKSILVDNGFDIEEVEIKHIVARKLFEDVLNLVIWWPESLREDWPLLKLVDAKIAELEKCKRK